MIKQTSTKQNKNSQKKKLKMTSKLKRDLTIKNIIYEFKFNLPLQNLLNQYDEK